jgi:hypothetical protein
MAVSPSLTSVFWSRVQLLSSASVRANHSFTPDGPIGSRLSSHSLCAGRAVGRGTTSRLNGATGRRSAVRRSQRCPSTARGVPVNWMNFGLLASSFSRCALFESAHLGSRRLGVIGNANAIRRKDPGPARCFCGNTRGLWQPSCRTVEQTDLWNDIRDLQGPRHVLEPGRRCPAQLLL